MKLGEKMGKCLDRLEIYLPDTSTVYYFTNVTPVLSLETNSSRLDLCILADISTIF